MERKKGVVFLIIGIVLAFLIVGCAQSRAKIRKQTALTVSDLTNDWQNYDVYYAGSSGRPIGILFDPKNDGFKLVGDIWTKVEDEGTLSSLVQAVAPGSHPSGITSRSNGQLVGYYSATRYTSTEQYYGGHTYNPIARESESDKTTIKVDMIRQNYPDRNY